MKYLSKTILFLAFSLLFIGCQDASTPLISKKWDITIDSTLQSKISVVNVLSRKKNESLLEVQFTLKNTQPHSDVDALYQIQWFDNNGFRIKSITDTFMKIHLGPNEEKIFNIISTSAKATTYKISIIDYAENKKRIQNDNNQYNN